MKTCPVCGKTHELWRSLVRWFRLIQIDDDGRYQEQHLGDAVSICPDEAYDLAFSKTRENEPAVIVPYFRSLYFQPPMFTSAGWHNRGNQ